MAKKPLIFLLAGLLLLTGCDDGGSSVQMVSADDPEMNAAIQEARETVGDLVLQLPELQSAGAQVSIKVPVSEGDKTEHIWLANLRYENGLVHGQLANAPADLPSWSYGDPVEVPLERISDWMVVLEGQLFGGYTLFAMRDRMQGDQRRRFEAAVGLDFPEEPLSLN